MPFAGFLRDFFLDVLLALFFLPAADLRALLLTVFFDDLEAADFFEVVFLAVDFLERFELGFFLLLELDFVDFLARDFLAFFVAIVCLYLPQSDGLREEELILPVYWDLRYDFLDGYQNAIIATKQRLPIAGEALPVVDH